MIKLNQAEHILKTAKTLKAAVAKYERNRDKVGKMDPRKTTDKRFQSANASLAQAAHEIEVLECELHAACVVGGVAEQRSAEEYEQRTWRLSGWHEYPWTPRHPDDVRKELAPSVSEKQA